MSVREMTYAILGILGATSFYFVLKHFSVGNPYVDFITLSLSTPITTTMLIDLIATVVLLTVWLLSEKRSVSAGGFWLCLILTWGVALSSGFALFLLLRERQRRLAYRGGEEQNVYLKAGAQAG